jgi:phenylpyruvate tautomerase PptA (4-oxalocrotonate tautomerase family)
MFLFIIDNEAYKLAQQMEGQMPIVSVFSAPPMNMSVIPNMMESIRDAGSSALKTPKDNVWVVFHPLPHYLNDPEIPYVTVKAQAGRGMAERSAFVEAIATEVGRSLSVPAQNVWIQYEEINPNDIWHGGHWAAGKDLR